MLGAISLRSVFGVTRRCDGAVTDFARDILNTGPWGLGLLRAAPSVGAVVMSLLLARYAIRNHAGKIMFAAVATFGLQPSFFGLSESFLLFAALLVLGASDMVSVVIRSSLIQLETPDEMRGRVSAVNLSSSAHQIS